MFKNMTIETLSKLRERVHGVFAQGLQVSSPDELDSLAQGLSALNLSQPAALITQIQRNLADRKAEKKDVESLIKVLQILSQAEIHLSAAGSVNVGNLAQVQGFTSLYVDANEIGQAKQDDLNEIMRIQNPFVRGHRMVEYVKHASYDELVRSVEIAWFDYSLSNPIVEGLRERPEDAFTLARRALGYKNLVMQSTAIRVWEQVGSETAYTQQVLESLQKPLQKSKAPLKYLFEEATAKVAGKSDEYLKARQARFNAHVEDVKKLTSPKKNERTKAIKALAKTKDPCFTDVLIRVLEDEDGSVAHTALEVVVKIGGVEAIPKLVSLLKTDLQHFAAIALYNLGDRRGLEYFLSRRLSSALESYVPFYDYGILIVHPLLNLIKTLEKPEQFKEGFFSLFNLLRFKEVARKITEYLERDAGLTEKFVAVIARTHPGQSETILKGSKSPYPSEMIKELVSATLSENPNKLVTRLKLKYLVQDLAITPDGNYLVTMTVYGEITLWKTDTWKKETAFTLKGKKYAYGLHQIALTPDGKYLIATNNLDHAVDILELGNWQNRMISLKHDTEVHSVAVTADGKYLLGGGLETVKIWEFGTKQFWKFGAWKQVAELGGHRGGIKVIKAIPGKNCVVTGDCNGVLYVWEQASWQKVADWKVTSLTQNTIAVSRDGQYVIAIETPASYLETKVKVWETGTWKEAAYLTIPSLTPINCFAFTPDGKYVIAATSGIMKILEVGSWREILTLSSSDDVRAVVVTPDGKYIIAGLNVWQVDLSIIQAR